MENKALLNIISPSILNFNQNNIDIGENKCKAFVIQKYPSSLEIGWLSKINNIKGTIVKSIFVPKQQAELVSAISKNIANDEARALSSNDANIRQQAETRADDGKNMLKQINDNGEAIGLLVNIILVMGKTNEELTKAQDRVKNVLAGMGCSIRTLPALQEQLFKSISPFDVLQEEIEELAGRPALLSTFMGGVFNNSDGFKDNSGYYFGKDLSGGLIILDIWKRINSRTNSNMTIVGKSGSGKSMTIKKLILNEYMLGRKVIIVDPEREYDKLTTSLDGKVIKLGGGKNKLNPLEINTVDLMEKNDDEDRENDDEDRENEEEIPTLALHLQRLDIFFSLYLKDITSRQKELLNLALIELYKNFNITFDSDILNLKSEKYPTLSDLYTLIKDKEDEDRDYEELRLLLESATNGSDSFLFNGHTNLSTNEQIICFDTHDLNEANDNVKKSQYFNLMSYIWKQVSKNRDEKIVVILEEAHILVDKNIPQTLIAIKNMAKRVRKYDGSLIVATQSVIDFLAEEIKNYGQAVLTQACYKLLLGADGQDLHDITKLFDLKEHQKDVILGGVRGRGLFIVGNEKHIVNIELPEYELKYLLSKGKGGR